MTEQLFKVIFRGEIAAGFTRAQVRDNLQTQCNIDPATAARMLYGQTVILKSGIDRALAERIRAAMARAGAVCSIVPVETVAPTVGEAAEESMPAASAESVAGGAPPPAAEEADSGGSAQVRWLLRELPKLVGAGVLNAEAAGRLRRHYAAAAPPRRTSLALVICAVLGALLVGLGIILIFAHNWSALSRPTRTLLSLAPLLAAQALTAWVIGRRAGSVAWREGAAVFLVAAVGAAIALVGQTYHLADDLGRFLLTWMLLALPLVFLLRSTMAAALYWLGIAAWAVLSPADRGTMTAFWLLVAPPGWLLWELRRRGERPLAGAWLLWVLAACLLVAVAFAGQGRAARLVPLHYGLLLGIYYLADRAWMAEESSFWRRPLLLLGSSGSVLLCLALTFQGLAREVTMALRLEHFFRLFASPTFTLLIAGYVLLLLFLLFRRRDRGQLPLAAAGVLLLAVQFAPHESAREVALLFNAYLLFLGAAILATGLRQGRLAKVNGAMGIFAMLLTARFFDTDLPFTVKGVAFVVVGASFLAVNLLLRRRSREVPA